MPLSIFYYSFLIVLNNFLIKLDFLTIIIVTNDDIDTANGVFDSRLIFTPTTSGTYYLSAGSYSANPNKDNSGAYSLTVTLTKETTPTDPTTPTTPDPGVGPDIEGTNRSETVNGTEQGETISGLGGARYDQRTRRRRYLRIRTR